MEMSLSATDLSYSYIPGTLALRDVTLSLEERGVTFILGGNGSGKTTLIQCLCGIRSPKSGSVQIDGKDLRMIPPLQRARSIGFVPQIHEPVFTYSVYQVDRWEGSSHDSSVAAGEIDRVCATDPRTCLHIQRLPGRADGASPLLRPIQRAAEGRSRARGGGA